MEKLQIGVQLLTYFGDKIIIAILIHHLVADIEHIIN